MAVVGVSSSGELRFGGRQEREHGDKHQLSFDDEPNDERHYSHCGDRLIDEHCGDDGRKHQEISWFALFQSLFCSLFLSVLGNVLNSSFSYPFAKTFVADANGEADGASLDATATDDKTVVVTLENACTYFKELLAFPTFAPVPATADATGDWAGSKNASSFVCNGPMRIKSFGADAIVFEPNPNYYDTAMVKATEIKFAFSDDATAMLNSYKTGSYQMIDDIPQAEIAKAATDYPGEFFDVGQLGTYYVCFNVNNVIFNKVADTEPKRESLRMGLSYLINRNYIVSSVTQGGQQPANGFVSKGLTGANGVGDWTDTNGANQDGKGWIDVTDTDAAFAANVEKGIAAIKAAGYSYDETAKKFTNVPSFEYLYNTSESHKAIAEYLQSAFAKYGITMNLKNQDWATFVATRKSGDFTIARNGWLCDYNDPISMLDMWISTSGNDDVQFGKA